MNLQVIVTQIRGKEWCLVRNTPLAPIRYRIVVYWNAIIEGHEHASEQYPFEEFVADNVKNSKYTIIYSHNDVKATKKLSSAYSDWCYVDVDVLTNKDKPIISWSVFPTSYETINSTT